MFGEEGDGGEKTESPSGRRVSQSRQQGMVARSAELSQVVGMTAAFYGLRYIMPSLWQDIRQIMQGAFTSRFSHDTLTVPVLTTQFYGLLFVLVPKLLLMLVIAAVAGAGCTALQTNFLWSPSLLKPRFNMINPLAGFQRILSLNNAINFGKQLLKLAIIGPIAYAAYIGFVPGFLRMMDIPIQQLLPLTADMASSVFIDIMKYLFFLGIIDYAWNRHRVNKKLMMSKQEAKDEKKANEGDETMRRRIIQIGLQRARDRMFQSIPQADVIVTNPTHIAVALAYSAEAGTAPRVIAKGKGFVAERIREIGKKHGIPIVERKPLARALFASVEVGQEIPYELFKAVAELLAYVYRLKGRNPLRKRASTRPAPRK
ncbi:MAG: EscU/YscU/HrcU family type III secretion system export apparatus switch protein [Bdellovibrionota bacterium]